MPVIDTSTNIANDSLSALFDEMGTGYDIESPLTNIFGAQNDRRKFIWWYLHDELCAKVCDFYAKKATGGEWKLIYATETEEERINRSATKKLKQIYAQESIFYAQIVANIIGSSVLIIDDGKNSETVATSPIKLHLMLPEQLHSAKPEDGFFKTADGQTLVHESRVMIFAGVSNPFDPKGWGTSRLERFLPIYEPYRKSLKRTAKELQDRSIFTTKQDGLKREATNRELRGILKEFYRTLRKGLDSLSMLLIDRGTMEAEWKERSFAGLDIPYSELRRSIVAHADIPEMEFFGSQDKSGLQEKGMADRLIVATKTAELQGKWTAGIDKLITAISPQGLELKYANVLQMSPLEEADIKLKLAQSDKTLAETEQIKKGAKENPETHTPPPSDESQEDPE